MRYVIGVDVGTRSARAGLFDETGHMLATASKPITMKQPKLEWAEQSSDEIWQSICYSVSECIAISGIKAKKISGISYSATCSLVLLDKKNKALVLSDGKENWNVIVWMDHRAACEAEEITKSGSSILNNLGGTMSPEMEIPKLMWLKRNRPELWEQLGYAGDLADFLVYHSCGSLKRSDCTLGCKWTYNADEDGWNKDFLHQIGLDDLLKKAQLPDQAVPVGTFMGKLTKQAASELGLTTNCSVASGLIDAHAGALGTLGLFVDDQLERRMALIAGTSNCHISLSPKKILIPGIWGPYSGAVINGMWCSEGGQSATGALLDHIVALFAKDRSSKKYHTDIALQLMAIEDENPEFAAEIYVIPDFIGNRTPFANPKLRGHISGLTIEDPEISFLKIYWAAAASIAYGTRLLIDRMNQYGYKIDTIHLSGGHTKSPLLINLYADATGCDVFVSNAEEPVLLGAAIAALAQFEDKNYVAMVTKKMNKNGKLYLPRETHRRIHNERYKEFNKHYKRYEIL